MTDVAENRNYALYETIGINVARLVFLAVFFAAWEYIAHNRIVNPIFIGIPSEIAKFLWNGPIRRIQPD